ncbi:2-dehydro-3-deoxy-D-gluconate 5-dehydrogenase KduD [Tropicimonas sp. IMCC34043]|uniref:2-dehydro-3-deoxy-D-gluconate 5-dehydrogenase KduD n=1 Tax=Tropicimonas sp. IMCC34043 TaxID=2248760 RepID=UPI000E27B977|nr:2-dehydro-3-deoxy-D-gluconate 5-dehydrogenase KduD [Tropicimonas sp. IMCC34043]
MISFSLEGKTALVTGANTGIGQGIAVGLNEAGAHVICAGVSPASDTLAKLNDGEELRADLIADPKALVKVFAERQIDILVNNAGIIRRADTVDFSEADWDDVMTINLKAVFMNCQAFAKAAITAGRPGKIINIASMLSFQGGIRVPSYTASKSGVAGITKLMANEWAAKGINVNAIAPGYIATDNTAALRADADRSAEILGRIPAGRWGTPEDIAGIAVFLAAPASDYVNGAIYNVDGGWLAR